MWVVYCTKHFLAMYRYFAETLLVVICQHLYYDNKQQAF